MKAKLSLRHYNFYRFLLQDNLTFKQKEDKIIIRGSVIVVVLAYEKTYLSILYTVDSRFFGLIITQKTYRKIMLMRKFV